MNFVSLSESHPEIAKFWHPTKNGNLTPDDVGAASSRKVWWLFPYNDPVTGKTFNFEWSSTVANRVNGENCPYLTGKAIWHGFNDLATVNPELAKEWHPTKNGDLKPSDVNAGSTKKVWWLFPYDDSKTGKHFDFEWEAAINKRNGGLGCPHLTGHAIFSGFNDLATINPDLAAEWHPTKNGELKPSDVNAGSSKKVWWLLPYDDPKTGKHFDFEWQSTVANRNNGNKCPYLSGQAIWPGFNDLATANPKLAKEWHPTKNGNLTPVNVTANSSQKVWWLHSYDDPITNKHFDFEWQASISSRNQGRDCPYVNGFRVKNDFNDLATVNPELAKEWHPIKNFPLTPKNVTAGSDKKVWWLIEHHNPETGKTEKFEWLARINDRNRGSGCPYFRKK